MSEYFALAARSLLALVFFIAGVAKLSDRRGTRENLVDFGVPEGLAGILGLLLPAAEVAVALLLAFPGSARTGAAGALTLLALFSGAAAINLARGRRPDCRCFGQVRPKPIGLSTLLRNSFLAAVAAVLIASARRGGEVAVPGLAGPAQGFDAWDSSGIAAFGTAAPDTAPAMLDAGFWVLVAGAVIGAALALAVAAEAWFILELMRQNGRLLARLAAVEAVLGIEPSTPDPGPQGGLPQGAPAPAFTLPGLDGRVYSLASLLEGGRPVVLIFSSAGCPACEALAADVARWAASPAGPVIAVISRGPAGVHRLRFGGSQPLVLFQEGAELERAYGVKVTPTAVVVDPKGRIGGAAAGARDVRLLVERLRSAAAGIDSSAARRV